MYCFNRLSRFGQRRNFRGNKHILRTQPIAGLPRDEKRIEQEYPLLFIHLRLDNNRRYTKSRDFKAIFDGPEQAGVTGVSPGNRGLPPPQIPVAAAMPA
jgi:hypothetical protein